MTVQPPALGGSRKVTILGWGAVAVVVILLVALMTALVRANGASNSGGEAGGDAGPAAAISPTPSPSADAATVPSATDAPADSVPAPEADEASPAPEADVVPGDAAAPVEKAPVTLTESAAAIPQLVFSLGALEAVDGEAQGPGEVAGPALRFTLTVRNDTAASVSLASTVVNLYAGVDQAPSMDLAEPGGSPLPDEVRAGRSATGTFVFAVPRDARNPVKIAVDYSAGIPVVVFEGAAPG